MGRREGSRPNLLRVLELCRGYMVWSLPAKCSNKSLRFSDIASARKINASRTSASHLSPASLAAVATAARRHIGTIQQEGLRQRRKSHRKLSDGGIHEGLRCSSWVRGGYVPLCK